MKVFMRFFVIVLVCAAAAFSQNADEQKKQKIAVYVTGSVTDDEKKVLGTKILGELINSKRYRAVERSDDFVKELDRELSKQMSGDVADNQITAIGKQYGVQVICVADWTKALGAYSVSARLIEVESAEIIAIADESCYIVELKDLQKISAEVARVLLGGKKDKKFKCADKPKDAGAPPPSAPVAAAPEAAAPAAPPAPAPAAGSNVNNNNLSNTSSNANANANNINVVVNTAATANASSSASASGSKKSKGRKSRTSIGARVGYFYDNALTVDGYFSTVTNNDRRIDVMMGYCGLLKYDYKGDTVTFSAIEFVPSYGFQAGAHKTGALSAYFNGIVPFYFENTGSKDAAGNIDSKHRFDFGVGLQTGLEVTLENLILGLDVRPLYMFLVGEQFQYTVGASARYRF